MADIANIGFKAETGALVDAKNKMEALVPAAGRAERSSERLSKMFDRADAAADKLMAAAKGLSSAAEKLAASTDRAANSNEKKAAAVTKAATATNKAKTASDAAAAAANKEADALNKAAAAADKAASAKMRYSKSGVPLIDGRSSNLRPWGDTPNRPQPQNDNNPLAQSAGGFKANVGNIAAQFQDIGVTAAMGMNPLLIALQQGTQLSMAMGGGVKALVAALATVFSPVALLTIGFVALAAALIQMVNWTSLAQTGLNALATVLPMVAQGVALLGAVVALAFAPAALILFWNTFLMIAAGIATLIGGIVASVGAIPLAIGLILADLYIFRDEWASVLGVDLIGVVKSAVNLIIGAFVGAYHDIAFLWAQFPDVIGAAAVGAVNLAIGAINTLMAVTVGHLNSLIAGANTLLSLGGTVDGPQIGNIEAPAFDQLANESANKLASAVGKRNEQLQKDLTTDYLGAMGGAIQAGAEKAAGKIKEFSAGLGVDDKKKKGGGAAGAKGGKSDGDKFQDIVDGADRSIAAMQAERDAIGLTEEATARLKYETQLLNEAKQKGIELTPQQRSQLIGLAGDMARLESETKKAKDALDFSKEATKGFVMDMKSSLAEGKSLWESFTNAIGNLANKLIDRGLNALIDKLFEVNSAASGTGGGGGIMGWLTKGIGALFGGAGGGDAWAGMRSVTANAKGNAFSNSIVTQPTMFAFGKGGSQLGIMGEKDDEAVMPLKRGPDGSLGVQMHGGSKTGGQMTSNVVVENHYTIAGAISSEEIQSQIRAAGEATREEVKRSVIGDIQQFQRDGAF